MKPVKVLGSGLSGMTAAICLATAGVPVEVFERNSDCGQRFLGDIQGIENWSREKDALKDLEEFGLSVNFDCDPLRELTVSNGQEQNELRFNKPACYLVKRGSMEGSLDQGLKAQALKAGVKLRFRTALPEEQADIIATGPRQGCVFALDKGIIFTTSMKDTAIGLVNDRAAFKGYAYLLVTGGYGCLCTVLFDNFSTAASCFDETKRMVSRMVKLEIKNPRPVGGIGSFSLTPRFVEEKRLYVGEAAGLQDLLWGFGIRTAMTSGHLAAKSILEGTDYEHLAGGYFKRRLRASLVNRYLWEKLSGRAYRTVVRKTRDLGFLSRMHNLTWPQSLLYPLAYASLRRRYNLSS